jgi:general stress protein YciG
MAGTKIGGLKAATKNLRNDPNFYEKIGAIGGSRKGEDYQEGGKLAKGFAANPELARIAAAKGGRKSRRGKAVKGIEEPIVPTPKPSFIKRIFSLGR